MSALERNFHCGVSRLITSIIWNFQRVLHTLAATQEVPRHTRLHSRGSTRVPPTSRGAPFLPPSLRRGILSLRGRERIPGLPVASQQVAHSTGMARGTPVSCHIPRVPQKSPSIPGKTFFSALPRLSSRGSTHTTVARGTALWESLVEKPRGKASWESLVGQPRGKASWESLVGKPRGKASDPFIHGKGSGTLLLQLGRKSHVHAPTRDEDRLH